MWYLSCVSKGLFGKCFYYCGILEARFKVKFTAVEFVFNQILSIPFNISFGPTSKN